MFARFVRTATGIGLLSAVTLASAQGTIHLVTPAAQGDAIDLMLREVAAELAPRLGQSVVVQNRPGAGGRIAIDRVASAAPDGQTLLLTDNSLITHPLVTNDETVATTEDFAPVALLAKADWLIAVGSDSELQSGDQMLQHASAAPESLLYATPGVGTLPHLAMEHLSQATGLRFFHVPYVNESRAATDVVAQVVDVGVGSMAAWRPHLDEGRVRLLGRFSTDADSTAAEVPPVANFSQATDAVADVDLAYTLFLVAPTGSPPEPLQQVNAALQEVMALPAVQQTLASHDFWPAYGNAEALANWVRDEYDLWLEVVETAQIHIP